MESDLPPPLHPDPEVAALLAFTPVPRRNKRHDGWSDEIQRGYILGLAETGNVDRAAQSVDRTQSGAWTVRNSAGAGAFSEAWDRALALYHKRNPRHAPQPGRPVDRTWPAEAKPDPEFASGEAEAAFKLEMLERILEKYWRKLDQEREARIEGRIVEADFYVRQLTFIEIAMDLGGRAMELLKGLERREVRLLEIAATPMSVLLDSVRRAFWAEKDEPDRPDLSPLGEHDSVLSTGAPRGYWPDRDGDRDDWQRRQDESHTLAAEAQRVWEEKARKEAEAWAKREARSGADETEAER